MSVLRPVCEESEDDGIISLKSNNIAIHRSDGVKHDLITVFNQTGISTIVEDVLSQEKTAKAKKVTIDDKGKIDINRSDGRHHDIGAVLRSQSELNMTSSSKTKGFSWQSLKPKISFTKNPSPMVEKRPSITSQQSKQYESLGYHPTTVRIVHMSDTFNFLKASGKKTFLPEGDILVHSGNFTVNGTDDEFAFFDSWLSSVKDIYHYRVVCLGHRDVRRFGTEWDVLKALLPNATHVLCNEEATILGIRFYGCPWHWGYNFNYTLKITAPSSAAQGVKDIPEGIDVLITHGPAYQRLDRTIEGENWGSRELADALKRIKPAVHLHGHLTEGRGFLPAFGHSPLTLNSAMCERSRQVMFACPHVIKCSQIFSSNDFSGPSNTTTYSSSSSASSSSSSALSTLSASSPRQSMNTAAWEFSIDFLV